MTGAPEQIPSPCIGVCRMDEDRGLCAGCLRTLDEIAGWSDFDDAERRAILSHLPARRQPAGHAG